MAKHTDDYKKLMGQQKFMQDVEQGIRIANREIIHEQLPEITEQMVLTDISQMTSEQVEIVPTWHPQR